MHCADGKTAHYVVHYMYLPTGGVSGGFRTQPNTRLFGTNRPPDCFLFQSKAPPTLGDVVFLFSRSNNFRKGKKQNTFLFETQEAKEQKKTVTFDLWRPTPLLIHQQRTEDEDGRLFLLFLS